ncbi:MAG: hypothetical protein PHE36_05005 [Novosphingobium sp.]|nr:hypothetical protein [Novosphingobium sp.]
MKRMFCPLVAFAVSLSVVSPAAADVWIAGNGKTLDVLIYGNSPDSPERMADQAFSLSQTDWLQLWQGGEGEYGWIAVSCIRRTDGGVQFEFATEQPSQTIAVDLAHAAARQYISRNGGTLIEGCGGYLNNQGQSIAMRFEPR